MDLNSLVITGRLTKDPVFKQLPTGSDCLEFTVAVNGYQDKATFFNTVMFGKGCKGLTPYLHKGTHVAVQGSIEDASWTGKDGTYHKEMKLKTFSVTLLGSGKKNTDPEDAVYEEVPNTTVEEKEPVF